MKRLVVTVVLAVLIGSFTGLAPAVRAQGDPALIGRWSLDDMAGETAVDSTGFADGQLVAGPVWTAAGRLGGGLDFDGLDDRLDLGSPDYWSLPAPLADSLTIALWMRADDFAVQDARLMSRAVGLDEQDHLWMVSTIEGTGLRLRLRTGGATTTVATEPGLLVAQRWHHVAAVYDGTGMILYLDGDPVASRPLSGAIDDGAGIPMALGNQPPGAGDRPFAGTLDEVRLYRRALAGFEVAQLAFPDGNEPPHAEFTAQPPSGAAPLWVTFDASASFDRDGEILFYGWAFGDGATGSGPSVSHQYTTMGNFTAVLTLVDDDLEVVTLAREISATDPALAPLSFTHEIVDADPPDFIHCKAAGDVDGDGLLDVLAAGAKDGDGFFWYHNPGWQRSTIVPPGVTGFSTDMAVGDVDGDGDLDAIIPKGFDYGETVMWYENPLPDGDPAAGPWSGHLLGDAPAHDVEVGDVDGDGRLDVVVRWRTTTLFLQVAPDTWSSRVIDADGEEGLDLADLDADGDLDAVLGRTWLENPAPGGDPATDSWPAHPIDASRPSDLRVHARDMDGDGWIDVVLAGSERLGERVSWYGAEDPVAGPWTEHVVVASLDFVHSLETADFDLDGDVDILAAEMHQSSDPDLVVMYRNDGDGTGWKAQVIAETGSHNMVVADLDADGDVDLLGANHSQPPLEIWRNDLDPFSRLAIDRWRRHVIEPDLPWRAVFVQTARIDDDLLPDVVTGGWWFRNPGAADGTWQRAALGNPLNNMAVVHDFDGDGDQDVLGTQGIGFQANGDFAWARNDGAGGFTVMTNVASGPGPFLQGVAVDRFHYQDPLQVALSWEDGTDTRALVVPPDPSAGSWNLQTVAATSLGEELVAGDIDGDRDPDILQGLQWLRNTDRGWEAYGIHPVVPPTESDRTRLADMNGDGRPDAVVGFGHLRPYGSLSWYEQPERATHPWIEHVIDDPYNPQSLDVADLDLDGDLDLVVGEHNKPDPDASRLIIYENLGGRAAGFRRHVIHTGDEHHDGTWLFDVEGDGDLDIVSIGYTHGRVLLYENLASPGAVSRVRDDRTPAAGGGVVLRHPRPNPFNPSTSLRFVLPGRAHVRLRVYDVRGRLVANLVDEPREAGVHEVVFAPRSLASGVYLAQLRAAGQVKTVRMLLVQ